MQFPLLSRYDDEMQLHVGGFSLFVEHSVQLLVVPEHLLHLASQAFKCFIKIRIVIIIFNLIKNYKHNFISLCQFEYL